MKAERNANRNILSRSASACKPCRLRESIRFDVVKIVFLMLWL